MSCRQAIYQLQQERNGPVCRETGINKVCLTEDVEVGAYLQTQSQQQVLGYQQYQFISAQWDILRILGVNIPTSKKKDNNRRNNGSKTNIALTASQRVQKKNVISLITLKTLIDADGKNVFEGLLLMVKSTIAQELVLIPRTRLIYSQSMER